MAHRSRHFRDPRVPHWCLLITPCQSQVCTGPGLTRGACGQAWVVPYCRAVGKEAGQSWGALRGNRRAQLSTRVFTGAESLSCPLADSSQVERGMRSQGLPVGTGRLGKVDALPQNPRPFSLWAFRPLFCPSPNAECIGKVVSVVMR